MVECFDSDPATTLVLAEIAASLALLRRQECALRGPLARRDLRYLERLLRGGADLAQALVLLKENPALFPAVAGEGEGVRNLEVRIPSGAASTKPGGWHKILGKRKRGAQPGNSNRIKHGGWSVSAKRQRAGLKAQLQRTTGLVESIKAERNRVKRLSETGPTNG
jgi:hypothetical protein